MIVTPVKGCSLEVGVLYQDVAARKEGDKKLRLWVQATVYLVTRRKGGHTK